ncbi:MAG: alpha/beta hydrolase [Pseudomonadota bacterium]
MSADVSSLDAWRASARDFAVGGRTLKYWTGGAEDGPALLLIHGFPTSSWDWRRVWGALCEKFRVVAMDMAGFGLSDKPLTDYLIIQQAEEHEALLASLGIGDAHVLAHDYGDTVAQELLARTNEGSAKIRFRSIVFLNGGLFPDQHRPRLIQTLLASPLGFLVTRLMTERSFSKSFVRIFGPETQPSPQGLAEDWSLIAANDGNLRMHKLIDYMRQRREHEARWVGALKEATIPLRLIDGGLDPVSGAHLYEAYKARVPNADAVLLPNVGHYPQLEDPAAVLAGFFEFHAMHFADESRGDHHGE